MRRCAIAIAVLAWCLTIAAPAAADDDYGAGISPRGDPVVYVSSPGADPIGGGGGSGTVECHLYNIVNVYVGDNAIGLDTQLEPNPEEGKGYLLVCFAVPSGEIDLVEVITYQPGVNVITPGTLANQALKELPLLYPRPRTAPPPTATQVVGIRTWMWVDAADWHSISATAAIPGLAATVTATPTKTIWDMGDGATVVCDGPGTPYDPARSDSAQSSDCTHTYEHDGTYNVRATIVWSVSWTSTTGAGGSLGTVQRSTQFPITVEQRQAVITG